MKEENKRVPDYFTPLCNFSRPMIIECCKEECSPFKTVEVAKKRSPILYLAALHLQRKG